MRDGRIRVTLLATSVAVVVMPGCASQGLSAHEGGAPAVSTVETSTAAGAAPTTNVVLVQPGEVAVTYRPTTSTMVPQLLDDCVSYVQFAAFVGDAGLLAMWNDADQDPATLRTACESLGTTDPARLGDMSARWADVELYMAAAAKMEASTTVVMVAPSTVPPSTAPPSTSPAPTTPPPTIAATLPSLSVVPLVSIPSGCDPNYSGCVPIASDVDCAGGSGNGPAYVQGPVSVIGADIYGLDRDGDGVACE